MSKPPWSWIRAILLMTDADTIGGSARPVSPDDVRDAALTMQLPVMGIDAQAQLLWLVVQFLAAPLPAGWFDERVRLPPTASGEAGEGLVYRSLQLRETRHTHPLLDAYREVLRTLAQNPLPTLAPQERVDALGWLHFVDGDGLPYFYNFRTGQMQADFPDLAELTQSSPLLQPPRVSLATDAYQRTTPAFLAARAHTELLLHGGVATPLTLEAASCAVRASRLWTRPMQLSHLLEAAHALGIDPVRERSYMWLAHLSLCLALPAGWVEHPTAGTTARLRKRRQEEIAQMKQMARGDEPLSLPPTFYQHSLLGFSAVQWEAPQLSHCRGVLHALRRHDAMVEGGLAAARRPASARTAIDGAEAMRARLRKMQAKGAGAEPRLRDRPSGPKRQTHVKRAAGPTTCPRLRACPRGPHLYLTRACGTHMTCSK